MVAENLPRKLESEVQKTVQDQASDMLHSLQAAVSSPLIKATDTRILTEVVKFHYTPCAKVTMRGNTSAAALNSEASK